MTVVRFKITSPRPGFTGEGAGLLYFRNSEAELLVDLDNWEPGNARGALSYFLLQGFKVEALDGVSVDEALRHPDAEANALLAEKATLQRQIDALGARDDVSRLRDELAKARAERARQNAQASSGDGDQPVVDSAGEGGVNGGAGLRADVLPPAPDATVADWRAYAVEIDPTLDDAAAKQISKSDLQARYGSAYGAQEGTVTA